MKLFSLLSFLIFLSFACTSTKTNSDVEEVVSSPKTREMKPLINQLGCESLGSLTSLILDVYPTNNDGEPELGNKLSEAIFEHYISGLDPHQIAFTEEILKPLRDDYKRSIDDHLEDEECQFIEYIASVFKKNAVKSYDELTRITSEHLNAHLQTSFDFRTRKDLNLPALSFAQNQEDLNDHLKIYLSATLFDYSEHFSISGSNEKLRELLKNHFEAERNNIFSLDKKKSYAIFFDAFLRSLDHHSRFLADRSFASLYLPLTGELGTIEASIIRKDGLWVVVEKEEEKNQKEEEEEKDFESSSDSLRPGDVISKIKLQGPSAVFVTVTDLGEKEFLDLLEGKIDTSVELEIKRPSKPKETSQEPPFQHLRVKLQRTLKSPRNFTVTHTLLKKQEHSTPKPTSDHSPSPEIGVLRIPAFYAATKKKPAPGDVVQDSGLAISELLEQGMQALIVDLRSNHEGLIQKASELAQLFIPTNTPFQIIGEQEGLSHTNIPITSYPHSFFDLPLIILVDSQTGGAAEAFVQAIKTHGRGIIAGDQSTSGQTMTLTYSPMNHLLDSRYNYAPHLGGLVLGTGRFFGADGTTIEGKGISSDVLIPTPMASLKKVFSRKNPYFTEYEEPIKATQVLDLEFRDEALLFGLAERSTRRLAQNEDVSLVNTFNESWQKGVDFLTSETKSNQKESSLYSLVEDTLAVKYEKLLQYRSHLMSQEKTLSSTEDYILQEASFIAQDYLELKKRTEASEDLNPQEKKDTSAQTDASSQEEQGDSDEEADTEEPTQENSEEEATEEEEEEES